MRTLAVSVEVVDGSNVTLNEQEFPGVTELVQVFPELEIAKSAELVLVGIVMLLIVKDRLLGGFVRFVTVIVAGADVKPWVWLPKLRGEGEGDGAAPEPVPIKFTVCVVPETRLLLSVKVRVADRLPGVVGVKVTVIVQAVPVDNEVGQVEVWKLLAPDPVNAGPLSVKEIFPVLVRVNVCGEDCVPRVWLEKVKVPGLPVERVAVGASPVPVTVTVCGVPEALSATLIVVK